jgi:hypothetical protein
VVKSGVCEEATSSAATITVSPATVPGTIPAQTICSGTTPADLVLTGNVGNVTKWMRSTDPGFPNGVNTTTINNTTTTLSGATIGTLTQTTYFRAYVKSGACAEEFASVTITVTRTRNVYDVTGGGAYCSGGTGVAIGLSGSDEGISYQLRNGTTNVGSPVAGTGEAISFGNVTAAGTYTVVTTGSCATNMNGNATVSIDTPPTTSNAGADQVVNGTSTTLAANTPATGNTGTWSIVSGVGGSFGNTSSPSSTFSGTPGTTYVLRWTITKSGTCPPSTSDVRIEFKQISTSITTTNPSTTYGATSVTLSATVTPNPGGGTVDFYVGTSTTAVGSGTVDANTGVATYTYNPSALNANTYAIKAEFLGSGFYTTSNTAPGNNGVLTISQAVATIDVKGKTVTYDGNAHGATGSATGVKGEDLSGLLSLGSSFTNVPGGKATWSFAGNTNYKADGGSVGIVIGKASTTTVVSVSNATYDGSQKAGSATVTGAGGLNQAVSVSYAGVSPTVYNSSSVAPTNAGTYSVSATYAESANHLSSSDSKTFTIGQAALTVVADNQSRQYSDPNPSFTGSLSGVVNGDNITAQYTTTATSTSAPGSYTIVAGLNDPNNKLSNYLVTSTNGTLTVTKEDARVNYTGATYASTSGATSSKATVTLSATIQDITAVTGDPAHDTYAGDIRKATVTFINRENNTIIASNVPVGLVSSSDTKTGTATFNWSVDIGNANSTTYTIGIIVNDRYTRNSSADNETVTVSKPLNDFVTGGGFLRLSNSAGEKAGDAKTKNNFGFSIKYNSKGTSLQGHINAIVRRTESNGLRVYQIKGNSMTSLSVNSTAKTATFNGKASIQDITDPLNPISVDGNATLQVTMTDKGELGTSDLIGITVWNKSGGLWFASNWTGTATAEQLLAGGNLVVRGGSVTSTSTSSAMVIEEPTLQLHQNFPNPFLQNTQVNFEVKESGRTTLKVFNVLGQEMATLFDDQAESGKLYETTFEPTKLPRGVYFYTLTNGKEKVTKRMVLEKN